jgi:hypothetical protein
MVNHNSDNKITNYEELMVSIQCCTYNHNQYIRQCLEGFVMQKTNFKFEAIQVHPAECIGHTAEKYDSRDKGLVIQRDGACLARWQDGRTGEDINKTHRQILYRSQENTAYFKVIRRRVQSYSFAPLKLPNLT